MSNALIRWKIASLAIAFNSIAIAQMPPSAEALRLSLKTMGKALTGCRENYTFALPGSTSPLLKMVNGDDGYKKTLTSLDKAENFIKFLLEHPEKMSGRMLVAILSTSDDFSIGLGSHRTEILTNLIRGDKTITPEMSKHLVVVDVRLATCQRSLYDAGDDFAGYVMMYVAAQDRLIETTGARKGAPK